MLCALALLCVPALAQTKAVPPSTTRLKATTVIAQNGMVVTDEALATHVGVEVLRAGGNAVDAAVAVGFALAVTFPNAGNLGGGGFMMVRLADGRIVAIDYRETAPFAMTKTAFLNAWGEADPKNLQGTVVRFAVPAGQPLTQGAIVRPGDRGFLAAALGPGMRAITVSVSATSGVAVSHSASAA